jgi:hypothetical protein
MTQAPPQTSLYDRDFVLWVEDVAAKLKARDFDNLDLDNLIEEVESLGKSDKRELKSRLNTLLTHLLKRIYIDSAYDNRGWELTIREQRKELQLLLEQSPSLKGYWAEVFEPVFQSALATVKEEYRGANFPETWPLDSNTDALLTERFWD